MKTLRALGVVVMMLVGVSGCAELNVQRPTAALTAMNLGAVTAEGFTMNFMVDVHNPNSVSLPLTGADYDLGMGGVHLLSNTAKLDQGLPANGSATVTMPVTVKFADLLNAEQAIVKSGGNVPYNIGGQMHFGGASFLGQTMSVPVQYSGTLPLKRILNDPQALLSSPAAQELAKKLLTSYFGQ